MPSKRDDIIFDYRLGYVRANCEIEGFDIIGVDGLPRIVTLGGYTSAEQSKSGVAWEDYLLNLFQTYNNPVQIFNGDTNGFTSAQELLMLIRDGLLFKPKLVICLSGFHNFCYKLGFVKEKEFADILKKFPFTNSEQLSFYNDMLPRLGLGYDKIYYGEENNTAAWEYWLSHQDAIHCLCEEFGIKHMTFLQPCIFSGEYKPGERETETLLNMYGLNLRELTVFHNEFKYIYRQILKVLKSRGYITDLSGLFDTESDVYDDACHVKREYTQIIANAIYEKAAQFNINDGSIAK